MRFLNRFTVWRHVLIGVRTQLTSASIPESTVDADSLLAVDVIVLLFLTRTCSPVVNGSHTNDDVTRFDVCDADDVRIDCGASPVGVLRGSSLSVTSVARGVKHVSSTSESKSEVTSWRSCSRRSGSLPGLSVSVIEDEQDWMSESCEGEGYFMCKYSLPNLCALAEGTACKHLLLLSDVRRSMLSEVAREEAVVCHESLESLYERILCCHLRSSMRSLRRRNWRMSCKSVSISESCQNKTNKVGSLRKTSQTSLDWRHWLHERSPAKLQTSSFQQSALVFINPTPFGCK